MQLKKILINNYRQLKRAEVFFDEELTILAGANNSGKTSIIELFKRIFQDKNFSKDDISTDFYTELKKEYLESLVQLYAKSKTENEFREVLKQFYYDDENKKPIAIKIEVEVQYNKNESISLFSDYLMELDEECTSFYFTFNYEINTGYLSKELGLKANAIFDMNKNIKNLEDTRKTEKVRSQIEILKSEYENFLFEIFDSSFVNSVYFTDKHYKNEEQISVKEFQSLFKYNYIKATRLLNDEKTDQHFSISKELLSHFRLSDDWTEFKTQIIKDIKVGLEARRLNEKVKKHSLQKTQKALENIEKNFDYNRGEFSLQTDISDELLMEFLSSSLQTYFEFDNGTRLKEFSQGLGISNLIYMCLKVEAFVKQYKTDVVNLFVIEEPEAHMHPQMERMLIKFINEILMNEEKNRVQGVITTHSSEMIRCSDLKNIRVLRIDSLLSSTVYDMNLFKQKLESDEERQFFSFLFSINYSDLIFANKIIMYEGDTEKLYIEKLLKDKSFENLSNQYISFVQVGGAYTHWYRKLVHFLKIKTLIITDIDYDKSLSTIAKIKNDTRITNAGLVQYYYDCVTLNMIVKDILPYCKEKCRQKIEGCLFGKLEIDQISLIQSDYRKRPCHKIKKPDYSLIKKKPNVEDINNWIKIDNHPLLKVVTQGENDSFTRTLEEAMLCKKLGITVESHHNPTWWKTQIDNNKLKLDIPNKRSDINVRDIINENKGRKTDFMYSVILNELYMDMLPDYIKGGLEWLAN